MNSEKIAEFTKQSGLDIILNEHAGEFGNGIIASTYYPQVERFAELLINECCSKLVEMGEGWLEFANNPPRGQEHNASGALFAAYRLKEDAVNEIQEHFGVG